HPFGFELPHIGRRDLRERAIPLTRIRTAVRQPVLWLGRRVDDAVVRHLRVQVIRQRNDQREQDESSESFCSHGRYLSVKRYAMTSLSSSLDSAAAAGIVDFVLTSYSRRSALTNVIRRSWSSMICTVYVSSLSRR